MLPLFVNEEDNDGLVCSFPSDAHAVATLLDTRKKESPFPLPALRKEASVWRLYAESITTPAKFRFGILAAA